MEGWAQEGAPAELQALEALGGRLGLEAAYYDGRGRLQRASVESVMSVIGALGVELRTPADAEEATRRIDAERSRSLCDPALVAWMTGERDVTLGPAASDAERLKLVISSEDGREEAWSVQTDSMRRAAHGRLLLRLPEDLPAGFHQLRISDGAREQTASLLVAPDTCYAPAWDARPAVGGFLPLYAVRSDRDLGVGDLSELGDLAAWIGGCGGTLLGTLPLLSTFLDDPFEPSPYSPISRSVFGELFVDLEAAAERLAVGRVGGGELAKLLSSEAFLRDASKARDGNLVDYRASWNVVRRGLEAATRDAFGDERIWEEIERFGRERRLIGDYTRFRAELAQRRDGGDAEADRRLYLTAQWLVSDQLRGMVARGRENGCGLYLDLPVGVNGAGFDAWRRPELYAKNMSMGAPPDPLFIHGQEWGFPPVIPCASRAEGHASFRESVEAHLSVAPLLRIDHAAGLHRCYWVPREAPASDGVYVHYPAEEYYAALSILSNRYEGPIIGENLGTIPDYVNEGLRRRGVLTMSIGQFELGEREDRPLPAVEGASLAALNTHDMPTFAAHWHGTDIDLHERLDMLGADDPSDLRWGRGEMRARVLRGLQDAGLLAGGEEDPRAVLAALLRHAAMQRPAVLLVNLEDLWLERQPQNVPGIVEGYPAWRRRAVRMLEEITSDAASCDLLRVLASGGERA